MKIAKAFPKVLLFISTVVAIPSFIVSQLYTTFGIQVVKHPLLWSAQPEPLLLSKLDPDFHPGVARWAQHLSYDAQLGIVLLVVNALLMALVIYSTHFVDNQYQDDEPFHKSNWYTANLAVIIGAIFEILTMLVFTGESLMVVSNTHSQYSKEFGVLDTHISTQVVKDYKIDSYKVHVRSPFHHWNGNHDANDTEYVTKIYKNDANKNHWYANYREIKTIKSDHRVDTNTLNLKRFDK